MQSSQGWAAQAKGVAGRWQVPEPGATLGGRFFLRGADEGVTPWLKSPLGGQAPAPAPGSLSPPRPGVPAQL